MAEKPIFRSEQLGVPAVPLDIGEVKELKDIPTGTQAMVDEARGYLQTILFKQKTKVHPKSTLARSSRGQVVTEAKILLDTLDVNGITPSLLADLRRVHNLDAKTSSSNKILPLIKLLLSRNLGGLGVGVSTSDIGRIASGYQYSGRWYDDSLGVARSVVDTIRRVAGEEKKQPETKEVKRETKEVKRETKEREVKGTHAPSGFKRPVEVKIIDIEGKGGAELKDALMARIRQAGDQLNNLKQVISGDEQYEEKINSIRKRIDMLANVSKVIRAGKDLEGRPYTDEFARVIFKELAELTDLNFKIGAAEEEEDEDEDEEIPKNTLAAAREHLKKNGFAPNDINQILNMVVHSPNREEALRELYSFVPSTDPDIFEQKIGADIPTADEIKMGDADISEMIKELNPAQQLRSSQYGPFAPPVVNRTAVDEEALALIDEKSSEQDFLGALFESGLDYKYTQATVEEKKKAVHDDVIKIIDNKVGGANTLINRHIKLIHDAKGADRDALLSELETMLDAMDVDEKEKSNIMNSFVKMVGTTEVPDAERSTYVTQFVESIMKSGLLESTISAMGADKPFNDIKEGKAVVANSLRLAGIVTRALGAGYSIATSSPATAIASFLVSIAATIGFNWATGGDNQNTREAVAEINNLSNLNVPGFSQLADAIKALKGTALGAMGLEEVPVDDTNIDNIINQVGNMRPGKLRPKFITPSPDVLNINLSEIRGQLTDFTLFNYVTPGDMGNGGKLTNALMSMNNLSDKMRYTEPIDDYTETTTFKRGNVYSDIYRTLEHPGYDSIPTMYIGIEQEPESYADGSSMGEYMPKFVSRYEDIEDATQPLSEAYPDRFELARSYLYTIVP